MRTCSAVAIPLVLVSPFIWGRKKAVTRTYQEDGVTIVENEGPGRWGKDLCRKIRFVETLSLGVEVGDETQMFWGPADIAVDSALNIYVLDVLRTPVGTRRDVVDCRLMKFDRNGAFVLSVGRRGEAPGEFQRPVDIGISRDGTMAVLDVASFFRPKVHLFDCAGHYQRTIALTERTTNFILRIDATYDGRLLAGGLTSGQAGVFAEYYSPDGEFIGKFPDEYRYGPTFPHTGSAGFGERIQVLGDKIYLSLPDAYEIRE